MQAPRLSTELIPILDNLAVISTAALVCLICTRYSRSLNTSLPGPRAYPIIGNILDMRNLTEPWKAFMDWSLKYGSIISVRILGMNLVVLSKIDEIEDLLSKRASIYSHRPDLIVVRELLDLGKSVAFRDYDKEWREMRKLAHSALGPEPVKKYNELLEGMAAIFARDVIKDPGNYRDILRSHSSRIILSITYGLDSDNGIEEHIRHTERTMHDIREVMAVGSHPCDIIPQLKYLPSWVPIQKRIARLRVMAQEMVKGPFEQTRREVAEGKARPSLTSDFLAQSDGELTDTLYDRILWTSGSMFAGGSETIFASILVFILAMVLNPEKQAIAQHELNTVFGSDIRLPTVKDRERLPYINALVKEVMRWRPVIPLGLPRRAAKEDMYHGMYIPQGSLIVSNVWALSREPHPIYPPDEFHPERFLDKQHTVLDPRTWAFGFGRRVCPGRVLAENFIFLFMSTILTAFTISPPDHEFKFPQFYADAASFPHPFDCHIVPRSDEIVQAVYHKAATSTIA